MSCLDCFLWSPLGNYRVSGTLPMTDTARENDLHKIKLGTAKERFEIIKSRQNTLYVVFIGAVAISNRILTLDLLLLMSLYPDMN